MAVVVAHVLLTRQHPPEVLLLRRVGTGRGDGTWDGPAGRAEQGETERGAALRELQEEVDLVARLDDLVEVHRACDQDHADVLHVFFTAAVWSGDPRNLEPHLAEALGWYSIERPPTPMIEPVQAALAKLQLHTPT